MTSKREWVNEQLRLAGYIPENKERVSILNAVDLLFKELEQQRHTPEAERTVVELFYKLASGHAIAPKDVQGAQDHVWKPFRLGDVPNGATVRVRADAYDGDLGRRHNGMVGRLVAARGGEARVQYAESTEGTGHAHIPDKLEVLSKR